MLRAEALDVSVPGRMLVRRLDLEIAAGERCGILGRNGAGKSTLLHTLAGLRLPDAGMVRLDGRPIAGIGRRAVARRLGVLLQEESRDYWGSTRDYALLGRFPHAGSVFGPGAQDVAIADEALAQMDLGALAGRAYRSLSGGERQRARLAALFAQQPALYLCDEPLQHLDLPHQVALLEALSQQARERGAGLLLVLHDLVFAARYCDRLLLLFGDGRYAAGPCADVLDEANLFALYGFPVEIREVGGERVFLPAREGRGRGYNPPLSSMPTDTSKR
jgi:iron complex transport system ATP-binding protein